MSATSSRCSKTGIGVDADTYCWLMASGSSKACSPSSLNRAAMACRSAVVFAPSGSSACHRRRRRPLSRRRRRRPSLLWCRWASRAGARRAIRAAARAARLHKCFVEIGRCASAAACGLRSDATGRLMCHCW